MRFNPITKEIFSDSGQFIKQLNCPLKKNWNSLLTSNESHKKICDTCNHEIINSAKLDDKQLIEIVKQNPNTCLKIDFNQHNIKIFTNGILEQK
jgi:hypothetical protein